MFWIWYLKLNEDTDPHDQLFFVESYLETGMGSQDPAGVGFCVTFRQLSNSHNKINMENKPSKLDKLVKISIILGVFIIALSIAWYVVVIQPSQEDARIEHERQEASIKRANEYDVKAEEKKEVNQKALTNKLSLETCLNQEDKKYDNMLTDMIAACNESSDAYNCGIQVADHINTSVKEAKDGCFKKYPQ